MNIYDILNIFLIIYIILFLFKNRSNTTNIKKEDTIIKNTNSKIDNTILENKLKNRDRDVLYNKLSAPERRHEQHNYININNITKINQYTQGEPDEYQLYGLLYIDNSDKKYQLFGRRSYPRSPEWEYYIGGKDSGGLDYKFPLDTKQEIFDNTTIINPIDNNIYNVKVYNFNKPRYIP